MAQKAYRKHKQYYRAFSPQVMGHYEEKYPFVSAQMNVLFQWRTGVDINLAMLVDSLIPRGVSPNTIAEVLSSLRSAHRDRLQLAMYSFQELSQTAQPSPASGQQSISGFLQNAPEDEQVRHERA